jgi:hypothetical protein
MVAGGKLMVLEERPESVLPYFPPLCGHHAVKTDFGQLARMAGWYAVSRLLSTNCRGMTQFVGWIRLIVGGDLPERYANEEHERSELRSQLRSRSIGEMRRR